MTMEIKMMVSLIILLSGLFNYIENVEIKTEYGPVIGTTGIAKNGRAFYSFRGIPFAKPPVGNLRFKAPERPESWTEPLNATKEGPYCIQRNYLISLKPPVEGQEDCLYLNVYTPKINASKPLPVLISIPYGGFFMGRATSDYYGPEYFMDKDLILVSANYRLGIMGFLTTLDDVAPGNQALKDQVLALKWVQENIENFGGNKNQVTIMGQSKGSESVHYHLISPLSKGLFHQAISESGTALSPFASMTNAQQPEVLQMQSSLVNCTDCYGNNTALIDCLRQVPAEVLLQTQDNFKLFNILPYSPYWQVTETKTINNPEPFLTKPALEYIQNNEFEKVPWIVGNVAGEGLLSLEGILRQSSSREELNKKFDTIFPDVLMLLNVSTNDTQTLYDNIIDYYLNGDNYVNISNADRIAGFINSFGDRMFIYPAYQTAMLHSALGHSPIWYYRFNYRGNYSYGSWFASTDEDIDYKWGVCHCDELLYLFKSPAWFPDLNEFDDQMRKLMINMWSNFVINGDPNPTLDEYENVTWPKINVASKDEMYNENFCYLDINGSFKNKGILVDSPCGMYTGRMKFWASQDMYQNFDGLDGFGNKTRKMFNFNSI